MKFEDGIVTVLTIEEAQAIVDIYEHKRIGRQNYLQAVKCLNHETLLTAKVQNDKTDKK